MAENFYTLLTATGKAKLANSATLGTKINFKTLKVGDGNGNYYEPTENQESLVHQVWSGNISSITTDETNTNWIITETIIPATDGGFFIREAGIFDEDGALIAISKLAATYKPIVSEGSTKDLSIKIILEVSNSSSVTLKIDPTVILATKADINTLTSSVNSIESEVENSRGSYANLEERLDHGDSQLSELAKHPCCRVHNSATQSVASGVAILAFDTEDFDTDNIHNSTTNTRLVCQTAGKYQITGCGAFSYNGTGSYRGILIKLNNSSFVGESTGALVASSEATSISTTTMIDMVVNDYVELITYHNASGAISVTGKFMMVKVG